MDKASNLRNGLVSWWNLDEVTGTRVDTLGNNDLTESVGAVQSQVGLIGRAALFAGAGTGFLTKASVISTVPCTIACWVNPSDVSSLVSVLGLSGGGSNRFSIRLGAGGIPTLAGVSGATIVGPAIPVGDWSHIAATCVDPSSCSLYLNGNVVGVGSLNMSITSGAPTIGALNNGNIVLVGAVDLAGIWSRALSGAEIIELNKNMRGIAYPF